MDPALKKDGGRAVVHRLRHTGTTPRRHRCQIPTNVETTVVVRQGISVISLAVVKLIIPMIIAATCTAAEKKGVTDTAAAEKKGVTDTAAPEKKGETTDTAAAEKKGDQTDTAAAERTELLMTDITAVVVVVRRPKLPPGVTCLATAASGRTIHRPPCGHLKPPPLVCWTIWRTCRRLLCHRRDPPAELWQILRPSDWEQKANSSRRKLPRTTRRSCDCVVEYSFSSN